MKKLIIPAKLNPGDTVATVSLSWGGAGDKDTLWRYEQGKKELEEVFGLNVIEMPHTLKGSEFIYNHPDLRAKDLMDAFKNTEIKGIIACIGGNDSIRMLPYIDFRVIKNNPKVFLGYSDSTVTHMICYKGGLSSFYGPTLLVDFAENNGMYDYSKEYLLKAMFSRNQENNVSESSIGSVTAAKQWTSEFLAWDPVNKGVSRKLQDNKGYDLLQGTGIVKGPLIGGCFEVFQELRGTRLFPTLEDFQDAILFFETSEEKPAPWMVEGGLRTYGLMGILNKINGIIWSKPMDEAYYIDYKDVIMKVLLEFACPDLPVLYNMNFGHTEPKFTIPYGAIGEIDCREVSFRIL